MLHFSVHLRTKILVTISKVTHSDNVNSLLQFFAFAIDFKVFQVQQRVLVVAVVTVFVTLSRACFVTADIACDGEIISAQWTQSLTVTLCAIAAAPL